MTRATSLEVSSQDTPEELTLGQSDGLGFTEFRFQGLGFRDFSTRSLIRSFGLGLTEFTVSAHFLGGCKGFSVRILEALTPRHAQPYRRFKVKLLRLLLYASQRLELSKRGTP